MKSRMTKIAAVALAATMCVPTPVLATSTAATATSEASGTFETDFGLYSPKLNISVPVKAEIRVNPLIEASGNGVGTFKVASNSIDIMNASVDTEKDTGIPINVAVTAAITNKADDVITEYNPAFTASTTSTIKKLNLELTKASADAVAVANTAPDTVPAFDSEKLVNLSGYKVGTAAAYANPGTAITKYGSQLSIDIDAPTTANKTTDTPAKDTFISGDAEKITPSVGSFAVTGEANTAASWKAEDIAVQITYDVRASSPLQLTAPTASPATINSTTVADVTITVSNVGEAKVAALACHNDNLYGDQIWDADAYSVTYATASGATTATIKLPKEDAGVQLLAKDMKNTTHDLVIGLSDGSVVVTTLTVS